MERPVVKIWFNESLAGRFSGETGIYLTYELAIDDFTGKLPRIVQKYRNAYHEIHRNPLNRWKRLWCHFLKRRALKRAIRCLRSEDARFAVSYSNGDMHRPISGRDLIEKLRHILEFGGNVLPWTVQDAEEARRLREFMRPDSALL